MKLPIRLNNIDWGLLRRQKLTLLKMTESAVGPGEREDLDGIINLLDAIQDYAVDEAGYSWEDVFGFPKLS